MDRRKLAREVAALLTDGRPRGCKCPADPGSNALPVDNRHINSPRCPLTRTIEDDEIAKINKRIDDLGIALQVLGQER